MGGRPKGMPAWNKGITAPILPRSFSFVLEVENGCWLWQGSKTKEGYGQFWVDGKHEPAHRWAYETIVNPLPQGLECDHLCQVTCCVKPWHIEPVTRQVNMLRGKNTFARINSEKVSCIYGHPFSGDNVWYRERKNGSISRECLACRSDAQSRAVAKRRAVTTVAEGG